MKKESLSHVSFSSAKHVDKIIAPFFEYFGFCNFAYSETYPNGSKAVLCNSNEGLYDLYQRNLLMFADHKSSDMDVCDFVEDDGVLKFDFHSEQNLVDSSLIQAKAIMNERRHFYAHIRESYEIVDALILRRKFNDTTYSYIFCFDKKTIPKKDVLKHLDVIQHLTCFFDMKAFSLIQAARKDPIVKPWRSLEDFKKSKKTLEDKRIARKKILEKMNIIGYPIANGQHFTKKELECIVYLISGNSIREIANKQKVSIRTIEKHIENIKDKSGYEKRSEIIDFALSLGLDRLIFT